MKTKTRKTPLMMAESWQDPAIIVAKTPRFALKNRCANLCVGYIKMLFQLL